MLLRILLVDDEDTFLSIAARALRSNGYEVVEAPDGLEAWALAQWTRFDLVITDNRMPHLSGAELVARLRERQPTLPILRLSGSHDRPEEGGVRTLFKPFSTDQLVAAVRSLLAHAPR
jgi:two-component system sensor histidine kinase/response regulator